MWSEAGYIKKEHHLIKKQQSIEKGTVLVSKQANNKNGKCVDANFNSFLTEALTMHLELIALNRKKIQSQT